MLSTKNIVLELDHTFIYELLDGLDRVDLEPNTMHIDDKESDGSAKIVFVHDKGVQCDLEEIFWVSSWEN